MKRYRIEPGKPAGLATRDPGSTAAFRGGKSKAAPKLAKLTERLEELQELLWAEHRHKVLVVLQGVDTAGKDGTIRHVFEGVNPQGVRVAGFKVPTPEELDRDFLWRVHAKVPGRGELVIFNRSHYEDVLVVRVHELVPKKVWQPRYEQINAFEKLLADTGTTILKFFLHIDAEEQRERLQARLDEPTKRWKFRRGDLEERKLWDDYLAAYEEALTRTSTKWAPWYVVPANKKWYRNLVVATVLVEALEGLKMSYPPAEEGIEGLKVT